MKKFFKEFKEFISRGNVLDMAVGIIIGGAFTAIVTALVTNILTPLINWIPGTNGTGALQVVLREAVLDAEGQVVTEALIIDFGAVISAIVTFILTALVLFIIIKIINSIRNKADALKAKKAESVAPEAVAAPAEETPAEEAPAAPAAPTEAELLAEIRDLLKSLNSEKE
ncbi:MAG: large conductance mechanosensitive channel protein MscL [Clostridiales bacterium]|nr:large conductance mechanosensitive channel protein MscL [Clostridiales bacterium]